MKKKHSTLEGDWQSFNQKALVNVRSKNDGEITRLYNLYRTSFISFAIKKYSVSKSTAIEIYQESFIALYQNIDNGKLTELSASLKTYLFKIGTNKLSNYLRKKNNNTTDIDNNIVDIDSLDETDELRRKQEITNETVLAMGEPCNTVLSLYYWEERSMAEIARLMKYKSEQVAKNRKLLCLKKLKEVLFKKLKTEDLI